MFPSISRLFLRWVGRFILYIDLSNILGGQIKMLGGSKLLMNTWAFLSYWGNVPGLPPQSTPVSRCGMKIRTA